MAQQYRKVKFNYKSGDSEELDITKGEILTVLDSSGQWWKVVNSKGQSGLVPSNYLCPAGEGGVLPAVMPAQGSAGESLAVNPIFSGGGMARTNLNANEPTHMYSQPDLQMMNHSPSLNITARAKFRYQGNRDDELSLEKGDEVVVIEKEADGWWKGRCGTKIGWFPFNYVEELEPERAQPSVREKKFVCGVIALYSFNSGNPEELTFQKGDLLDIIDQPADDPEWWEARKANGNTGLIPRNYVEVVHDAVPVFGSDGGATNVHLRPAQAIPAQSGHPPPPFAHEVWYHGKVNRRDAEALLNQRANHGQFIVRSSETKPGDYSISMKAPDRIKHFNVKNLPDGRLGIGQRKFDSMDELIQHYRRAPIYTTTNEGKMYLTEGLPRLVGH